MKPVENCDCTLDDIDNNMPCTGSQNVVEHGTGDTIN